MTPTEPRALPQERDLRLLRIGEEDREIRLPPDELDVLERMQLVVIDVGSALDRYMEVKILGLGRVIIDYDPGPFLRQDTGTTDSIASVNRERQNRRSVDLIPLSDQLRSRNGCNIRENRMS